MERFWLLSYVVAWGFAVVQGLALFAMVWAIGRIHLKSAPEARALITAEGPELHSPMPEFSGQTSAGGSIQRSDYHGSEVVVLCLSAGCDPCQLILRALPVVHRSVRRCPGFLVVLESSGEEPRSVPALGRHAGEVILDPRGAIREALGVERTPYGFLVDHDGIVRMKGVVSSREQLEGLIARRGRRMDALGWEENETAV